MIRVNIRNSIIFPIFFQKEGFSAIYRKVIGRDVFL